MGGGLTFKKIATHDQRRDFCKTNLVRVLVENKCVLLCKAARMLMHYSWHGVGMVDAWGSDISALRTKIEHGAKYFLILQDRFVMFKDRCFARARYAPLTFQ